MNKIFRYNDGDIHHANNETDNILNYANSELVLQFSNNKRISQPLYGVIVTLYR